MGRGPSEPEVSTKPAPGGGSGGGFPSKMKVTVCFGPVRVIVPCPNREMLVSDLIHEAGVRYRKAMGKSADSWLVVQKLKTECEGGILDPDDRLVDVADDREQIMAIYEEEQEGMPSLQHIPGDGTSASSVGTSSPDIFQNDQKFGHFGRTDIEITDEELNSHGGSGSPSNGGLTLQVRRGSEPALNRLSPIPIPPLDTSKRWSAAPIIDEDAGSSVVPPGVHKDGKNSSTSGRDEASRNGSQGSVNSSSRENSVIFNSNIQKGPPVGVVGSSATGTVMINSSHSTPTRNMMRREPLSNQNQNSPLPDYNPINQISSQSTTNFSNLIPTSHQSTFLPSPTSSVGSHFQHSPAVQMRHHHPGPTSNDGPNYALLPPSRFSREINRHSMQFAMDGKWADAADRALFLSLRKEPVGAATSPCPESKMSPPPYSSTPLYKAERDVDCELRKEEVVEVRLRHEEGPLGIHLIPEHRGLIIQGVEPGGRIDRDGRLEAQDKIIEINGHPLVGLPFQQAQELFRQGLKLEELQLKIVKSQFRNSGISMAKSSNQQVSHVQHLVSKFNGDLEEKENMIQGQEQSDAKVATVRKASPGPVQSLPLMRQSTHSLISANTRKIGRKYEIELKKGDAGLGFSITTRDNPAGGNCPIYIKNVLPTGSAIDDGRLRPGDRLLEVNGIEITGKSQSEAVSILRNVPQGGIVKLLVSRQERVDLSPKLPRQIPPDKVNEEDVPAVPWSEREILVLDIPVLDTEKAGLGISVKGNAQKGNLVDNGIYIKSVIHGGAASRDGRLKSNDQLLSVNDVSLLNRSNVDAMETLRRTLTQDGPKPKPGFITLRIARRIPTSSAPNSTDMSACGSSASGDELDSWGSRNVSFSADGSRGNEREGVPSNQSHVDGRQTGSVSKPQDNLSNSQFHISQNNNSNEHISPQVGVHNRSSSLRVKSEITPGHISHFQHPHVVSQYRSDELPRHPVVERLTGKVNGGAVRSESYYRATNEPRNSPLIHSPAPYHSQNAYNTRDQAHLLQNRRGEFVLLENDYSTPSKPPRRSGSLTPEDILAHKEKPAFGTSKDRILDNSNVVPYAGQSLPSDVTYASQTSLEEDSGGFARDAFGRMSMSEKRHATLDAKGTDTYQRNKKLREERERQRQEDCVTRGLKRPFAVSNESHVGREIPEMRGAATKGPELLPKKSASLTFGDQLRELLHQWKLKEKQDEEQKGQRYKMDGSKLQRGGSTDSLVESLKTHRSPPKTRHEHSEPRRERRGKKDIGPSLGMKKSSSLESLQTMVQEIQIQEDVKSGYGPLRSGPVPVKVIRGRGCNESFRQAVDRSYEAPLGDYENEMETLAEEENESCISGATNRFSQQQPPSEYGESIYGKTKGSSKKKPGLFRGLGSMFRFGRHRKSIHGPLSANELRKQQADIERLEREDFEQAEQDKARQVAQAENLRIQEQYRRLVESEREESAARSQFQQHQSPYGITVSIGRKSPAYGTLSPPNNSLRPNHPFRKSMDCHRQPSSRSAERDLISSDINGNPNTPSHLRSASYDLYNEITRPGSRSRIAMADPKKYSHYINYDEIRHHLNASNGERSSSGDTGNKRLSGVQIRQMKNTVVEQRKKAILESRRHQQHYHSQRRENPKESRQERPVSNYYEYESVPALQEHGGNQAPSNQYPPLRQQQQPIYVVRNQNGNNGVTLPSPTTMPFHPPAGGLLRQKSASQFQVPQQPPFYATRQQQFHITNQNQQQQMGPNLQKQNSLPRRSQYVSAQVSSQSPGPDINQQQRYSHHHQQQAGLPSKYSMTHSNFKSQTHVKTMQEQHTANFVTPYATHPQIIIGSTYSLHNNAGGHQLGQRSIPSTTSLGSKV